MSNHPLHDRLASRVSRHRRRKQLTMDVLASRAGVSIATVSELEKGRTSPTVRTLEKLAGVLGVTVSALVK